MDFYANDSLGPWTPKNEAHRPVKSSGRRPKTVQTEKATLTVQDTHPHKHESQGGCSSGAEGVCCGGCDKPKTDERADNSSEKRNVEDEESNT